MTRVQATPPGTHSLTPHLICRDAMAAIDFYVKAFGGVELSHLPGPNGKLMHAMLRRGDSTMMLAEGMPEFGSLSPLALRTCRHA